jgi:hypothetical protein
MENLNFNDILEINLNNKLTLCYFQRYINNQLQVEVNNVIKVIDKSNVVRLLITYQRFK